MGYISFYFIHYLLPLPIFGYGMKLISSLNKNTNNKIIIFFIYIIKNVKGNWKKCHFSFYSCFGK